MPVSKIEKNKKIALVMIFILAVAGVMSITTKAFAQDSAVAKVESGTGLDRVIEGTENWNGSKDISVEKFLTNIVKSTGIYKMIHQPTAEEIAQENEAKQKKEEASEKDSFAGEKAPGWQYLIMIVIGFLIICVWFIIRIRFTILL